MSQYILAIDQGTTSSRAMLFDQQGQVIAKAQQTFKQYTPHSGWVEHDGEGIWKTVVASCKAAIKHAKIKADDIACIGITNQRETTLLWDKQTGELVANAIVWQDRRTADYCHELKQQGLSSLIQQKTGLLIDPYFSASKIRWLLDNYHHARELANQDRLAFGTIDSFLMWRLTAGKVHATDLTNAARTLLFNIHKQDWDQELLDIFDIPASILPEVHANTHHYGDTDSKILGASIPITASIGDQQAASFGQACFTPGMVKATYGTGCFVLLNTGDKILASTKQLLTTPAYSSNGDKHFALEGSIFNAGTAMKWLIEEMHLLTAAAESEAVASSVSDTEGVYFVPAFTGLGAPYWDANARATITGISRGTSRAHIVRAALEGVVYRTKDLLDAMAAEQVLPQLLRVDGGMVANNWLCQFLADILNMPVERAAINETTALGAAFVAGLQQGIFPDVVHISNLWRADKRFIPNMHAERRDDLYQAWLKAIDKTLA